MQTFCVFAWATRTSLRPGRVSDKKPPHHFHHLKPIFAGCHGSGSRLPDPCRATRIPHLRSKTAHHAPLSSHPSSFGVPVKQPRTFHQTTRHPRESAVPRTHFPPICTHVRFFLRPIASHPHQDLGQFAAHLPHSSCCEIPSNSRSAHAPASCPSQTISAVRGGSSPRFGASEDGEQHRTQQTLFRELTRPRESLNESKYVSARRNPPRSQPLKLFSNKIENQYPVNRSLVSPATR